MKKYSLGIDIGGTTVKLGLFNNEGELLHKWEIETRKIDNGKYILSDITKSINRVLEEKSIYKDEVLGAGVGVPGPVKDDGTILGSVNLGWQVFNVATNFEEMLNVPVKVANDANIAALGEMYKGGGKGYKNMIMVTLGTGVGGGVIINNNVIAGDTGSGGEIGHMTVNPHEKISCNCGRKGCLEQYASATGIARLGREILEKESCESKLRNIENITAKDVFDFAKENDELSIKVVEKFSSILGRALSNIACVCNPEVFVIGGGVSKAGDILLDNIKKYYSENAFHATTDTTFKLATLGNDAGIFGGAKLAREI
ncbi:ROK family glucokinase [Terrisporobacter vanillatitrophus]|uniref:ROK family glucokinase n=1 Tax=Terrisporobacter vanillatitrophus TaxID=3058402 RepID=UPI00336693B4